ncbi:MAG: histidinol dehydrogenase [Treponema sp.]|nr:histidinol dehydrogenase [Treponema sp.]
MRIISGTEFDEYWKVGAETANDGTVESAVKEIIAAVRTEGDAAVRRFASRFDKSSPAKLEVPMPEVEKALRDLRSSDPELASAMELAADHIKRFSLKQRAQFSDFEYEMEPGLTTGQRVIPIEKVAVYAPGGRYPLFSSLLMALIPAYCAGAEELVIASPPQGNGLPDKKILAAAGIAAETVAAECKGKLRVFAVGGVQAIAALALGTESVPRVDMIAGPGSMHVVTAKRILFGEVGIDFLPGPSDVLIISDGADSSCADFAAADMIAQAEHDPDARAWALVPNRELAEQVTAALERRLTQLPTVDTARASLDSGGLIVVYQGMEEAVRIANAIAPEHLELHIADADRWIPSLKNYGSLFIGNLSAEVLGDYSAGTNHVLPTMGNARFTGGLSVRHFLKTVTTLRCAPGEGFEKTRRAAEVMARAEGLEGHALSAAARG